MAKSIDEFLAGSGSDDVATAPSPTPTPKPSATAQSGVSSWLSGEAETGKLGMAFNYGVQQKPDQAARILRLQAKTGLAQDLIERNVDTIEMETRKADFDPERFRKTSPIVSGWLSENPNHVAAAQEDLSRLGYIERQWRYIKDQFKSGNRTTELSTIGESALFGRATPDQRKRQAELEKDNEGAADYGIEGFFEQIPGAVANQLPIFGKTIGGQAKAAAVGAGTGAAIGGGAGALAGGVGAVPGAVAGAGTGALLGWRYGAGVEAARTEAGLAFLEFEKMKDENGQLLDPATARGAAVIVGGINGALESVGLKSILKTVPGLRALERKGLKEAITNPTVQHVLRTYAKGVGEAMGKEGATEFMQEMVKSSAGELAKMAQDGSLSNLSTDEILGRLFSEDKLGAAIESGRAGMQAGGGTTVVTGGASAVLDVRKAKQAEAAAAANLERTKAAQALTLKNSSPEAAAEVLGRMAPEAVYTPVESWNTYWQSQQDDQGNPIDPRAKAIEVAGNATAYDEAMQTGGDIAFAGKDWTSKIDTTEAGQYFANETRTDPLEMTGREAQEKFKEMDAADAKQAEQQAPKVEEAPDPSAQIKDQFTKQLTELKNAQGEALFSDSQIEKYSSLLTERTKRRSDVRGQDPMAVMKDLPLMIQALQEAPVEEKGAQSQVLNQSEESGAQPAQQIAPKNTERRQTTVPLPADVGRVQFESGAKIKGKLSHPSRLREALAKGAFANGSAVNQHTGQTIQLTQGTADRIVKEAETLYDRTEGKTRSRQQKALNNFENFVRVASALPQIVKNAVYYFDRPSPFAGESPTQVFFSSVNMNGRDHLVRLDVQDGEVAKVAIVEESAPSGDAGSANPEGPPVASVSPKGADVLSISEFERRVNEARGQYRFFQEGPKTPRGSIQISEAGDIINLFTKKYNLSTFLHESGHRWLHEIGVDVEFLKSKEASSLTETQQKFLEDADTVLKFLGVESFDQIQTEHHEKWARATEAYLREGNAPSKALRRAFANFKRWLTRIYQQVAQLDVELNPEIRGVMDRLLASDQEIAEAQTEQQIGTLVVDPKAVGMNEKKAAAYNELRAEARSAAEDHFSAKLIKEMEREDADWWKEERDKVRQEIAEEVNARREYIADSAIRRGKNPDGTDSPGGKIGLSKQAISQQFGKERLEKLKGLVVAKEGIHPDVAAESFGFTSGDEMLTALEGLEDRDTLIDRMADSRMKELHGDLVSDPVAMKAEAIKSVHNEKQDQLLRFELEYLAEHGMSTLKEGIRRITRRIPPTKEVKEWAARQVGSKQVGQIKPYLYERAAVKAAKEAGVLFSKGNIDAAFEAKLREMRNRALFKEATEAVDEVEKIEKYADQVQKKTRQARLGKIAPEWRNQFDRILFRFGFRPSAGETKDSVADWIKSVKEQKGEDIAASDVVLNESRSAPYKMLSLDDLRGVYDTLRSIEHIARTITEVKLRDRIVAHEEAVELITNRIHESLPNEKPLIENEGDYKQSQKIFDVTRGFLASNLRPEKIFERLDGGKKGLLHDLFWNRAVDAQVRKDDLREEVMSPLVQYTTAKMSKERQARMNDRVFIKAIGQSITRRSIIGIVLNLGNESNKAKMMDGGLWFGEKHVTLDHAAVAEIVDQLDAEDTKQVQTIWDSVDILWPHLRDLHERATGLPLNRIEATPLQTKHGELRGGYWPAVGDPRHGRVGEKQENADAMATEIFAPKYPKAATPHSQREARTGAVYPIQLDWQRVLSTHIEKSITDIAYHEWIKEARRLLEAQPVKKAIQNRMGESVYRGLEEWLVHQVRPVNGGYLANQDIDSLQNTLMSNTAVAALGFNVATAFGNAVVAPVQAMHQFGVRQDYMVRGVAKFLSSPKKAIESVHELSGELRHRHLHLDQTYDQVRKRLEGKTSIKDHVALWSMAIHSAVDKPISTALWLGKYQQEIDKGESPDEAVRTADKMIRTTQTAGAAKDLSSFERDPRYRMFKMFLGPMIIMQNEMRGAVAGKGIKAVVSPEVWATAMATWIIPSVLFELAVGRGPDDGEDEEKWLMRKILLYPAMTLPFVRDAASATEQALAGKRAMTRSNPIADVLTQLAKSLQKAFDEDAETGVKVEAAARAAGPLLGVPTNAALKVRRLFSE